MVKPLDPPAHLKNNPVSMYSPHPDEDTDVRQALQQLLYAAEKAGDYLPGGIPEGLALREAIQKARRFA